MNQIILIGRLSKDPELRYTPSNTAVVSFAVAVDKLKREDGADFIDCVAWKNTAEHISKYFTKGKQIALRGRLTSRDWTDKQGNKRRSWEVVVESVEFVGAKTDGAGHTDAEPEACAASDFTELSDDGDLPF